LLNPPQRQSRPRRSNTTQSLLADEADEGVDGNEADDLQASDEEEHTRQGRGRQLYVSELGYAVFFMQDRNTPDHSLFIYRKKLFQLEWLVDQFCKIESRRLLWVRMNQIIVHSDLYQGLADAWAAGDTNNLVNLGRRVILPLSFVGSPRYLQQLYQDAMGIVRALGRPDYFITMTCNPNWPEMTNELKPGGRYPMIVQI
jgi:hypothetical protein